MKKLLIPLTLLSLLFVATPAFGQQDGPNLSSQVINIGPNDKFGNPTPIGGLAVFAVLGGGYAIKKLRDSNRKE